jgi:hypothetical protein
MILNPDGMFATDLKALAQMESTAKPLADAIDAQIEALKDIRFKIMQPSVEKREALVEQVSVVYELASDDKQQKLIKTNMHHLISFRTINEFKFDEEAARDYIIEHKLWDLTRKPTVAKNAVKKAFKAGTLTWLEAEEVSKTSVSIGKLGELLIVPEVTCGLVDETMDKIADISAEETPETFDAEVKGPKEAVDISTNIEIGYNER